MFSIMSYRASRLGSKLKQIKKPTYRILLIDRRPLLSRAHITKTCVLVDGSSVGGEVSYIHAKLVVVS